MANPNPAGSTPANVAKMATLPGVLSSGGTILIGLFGLENDLTALVREAGRRIRKVKPGQTLSGGRVVGIDKEGIVLERAGRTWRLDLPS